MTVAERLRPSVSLPFEEPDPYTSEQFAALRVAYPDLRIEPTKEGELILMPPTSAKTGMQNAKLATRLGLWNEATGLGEAFDSSTVFLFPNGAKRSPDASWIEIARWEALTEDEQEDFAPICPDFVVELRSRTDRLSTVQKKMQEYTDNGARLGWLIVPKSRRVEIYRPGQDVETLDYPTSLSGEPVLPGFILELKGILS